MASILFEYGLEIGLGRQHHSGLLVPIVISNDHLRHWRVLYENLVQK